MVQYPALGDITVRPDVNSCWSNPTVLLANDKNDSCITVDTVIDGLKSVSFKTPTGTPPGSPKTPAGTPPGSSKKSESGSAKKSDRSPPRKKGILKAKKKTSDVVSGSASKKIKGIWR